MQTGAVRTSASIIHLFGSNGSYCKIPPPKSQMHHTTHWDTPRSPPPPVSTDLPMDGPQQKLIRTRRTRPLTLASFPPHFRPRPSSPLKSTDDIIKTPCQQRRTGRFSWHFRERIFSQNPQDHVKVLLYHHSVFSQTHNRRSWADLNYQIVHRAINSDQK